MWVICDGLQIGKRKVDYYEKKRNTIHLQAVKIFGSKMCFLSYKILNVIRKSLKEAYCKRTANSKTTWKNNRKTSK